MGVPYSFIYPFTMTDRLTPQSRVSGSWKLTWNNLLIELNGYAWRRLIEGTKRYVSWLWLTVSGDDRLQTDRRKSCVIPTRIRRFSHSVFRLIVGLPDITKRTRVACVLLRMGNCAPFEWANKNEVLNSTNVFEETHLQWNKFLPRDQSLKEKKGVNQLRTVIAEKLLKGPFQ